MRRRPTPTLGMSLIPVVVLIAALFYTIIVLDGSGHIPLILGSIVAAAIAAGGLEACPGPRSRTAMTKGISTALPAILILIIVGLLIGVWIASGVVPVMIFYGLKILAPAYFLVATLLICALISLATGSSWSTAATVGLAMMGVGQALGIPPGMTAGAVDLGRLLRRQDVSPLRHHEPGAGGGGHGPLHPHPAHGLHHRARPRYRAHHLHRHRNRAAGLRDRWRRPSTF